MTHMKSREQHHRYILVKHVFVEISGYVLKKVRDKHIFAMTFIQLNEVKETS